LRHRPLLTLLAVILVGAGLLVLTAALRQRRWAAGTASLFAGLFGSFWIVGVARGAVDSCVTLRPFAEAVRTRVDPDGSVFFFREPLPVVALYAQRRIPTLRDSSTRPPRPFYLIVPESLAGEVPEDWAGVAETVAETRGRAFTSAPMRVQLLRVPTATESAR
jgi:hypothetical protein